MEKTTAPKTYCFVLMPFAEEFNDVYQIGIKEACENAGAYCERVDEQIFDGGILDRIYNQIAKADVVIADMTGRSANVFYEVGYAHALGKRTILLTQDADDIPFDLIHFPHIIYEGGVRKLRDELKTRVEWCIANPIETAEQGTIDVELFLGKNNLADRDAIFRSPESLSAWRILPTIYNVSGRMYDEGDLQLAIIVVGAWAESVQQTVNGSWRPIERTPLPTGDSIPNVQLIP